ncbi:MAG: peptide deformylase [Desulfofustis sp.]|nr:peptide deformylase [Desulfofustis sp.]
MALRKIIEYPEPLLRLTAKKVDVFNDELKILVEDMAETMWDAPGIGLAAPQVAQSIRVIVVDITEPDEEKHYIALINPEIIEHEGTQLDEEGCLSVPELTAQVQRYKKITVNYQTEDGESKQLIVEDRFAVVLQHEIDHLNGVLFIDHLSPLKRNLYKKKRKKMLALEQTG